MKRGFFHTRGYASISTNFWPSSISEGGGEADTHRKGAGRGFRGAIAGTIWAERYKTASIDYQIPIKNFSFATSTIAPFADFGTVKNRGGSSEEIQYSAYGIGTYLFLKGIAIPGMGLEFGTNNKFQKQFVNFSLGLSL